MLVQLSRIVDVDDGGCTDQILERGNIVPAGRCMFIRLIGPFTL